MNKLKFVPALIASSLIGINAYAAGNMKGNINTIIQNPQIAAGITVGFGILALFKWIQYFGDFKPESALQNAIVPAMLTFLTFQWQTVLGWVLG